MQSNKRHIMLDCWWVGGVVDERRDGWLSGCTDGCRKGGLIGGFVWVDFRGWMNSWTIEWRTEEWRMDGGVFPPTSLIMAQHFSFQDLGNYSYDASFEAFNYLDNKSPLIVWIHYEAQTRDAKCHRTYLSNRGFSRPFMRLYSLGVCCNSFKLCWNSFPQTSSDAHFCATLIDNNIIKAI